MTTLANAPSAEALAPHFSGELVGRDHPAYDAVRQVWNGEIQRHPLLVARARGAADVAAAITGASLEPVIVTVMVSVARYCYGQVRERAQRRIEQ